MTTVSIILIQQFAQFTKWLIYAMALVQAVAVFLRIRLLVRAIIIATMPLMPIVVILK